MSEGVITCRARDRFVRNSFSNIVQNLVKEATIHMKKLKSNKSKDTKYSNEEITSAITLASIMVNDNSDGLDPNVALTADKGQIKNDVHIGQAFVEPKNSTKECPPRDPVINGHHSYAAPPMTGPTMTTKIGHPNPYGSLYGFPMDPSYGYPQCYPMYAMNGNFGPTPAPMALPHGYGPMIQLPVNCESAPHMFQSGGFAPQMTANCGPNPMAAQNWRQCPYCLAPNAPMPPHSQYVNVGNANGSPQPNVGQIGGDVYANKDKPPKESSPSLPTAATE